MTKYLLLLLFLWGTCCAQIPAPDTVRSVILLKVTPLSLFDVDNTLQGGIELPLKNPAWTIQQEFGYGHTSFNFWQNERRENPDRETWRFRTQIRYYFRKRNQQSPYIAGEYLFKKNSEESFEAVGMDCTTGQFGRQCSFFQNRETHLGRFVNAFHFKWGWQYAMADRWTLDVYIGLGLRSLTVRHLGLPREAEVRRGNDFFSIRTNSPGLYGPLPSYSSGIHFGYRLGK